MKSLRRHSTLVAVVIFAGVSLSVEALAGGSPKEAELLAVLTSGAPLKAKVDACRQLARIGTVKSVPVLARLLRDEKLSHMARYALEPIPDPAVDAALRKALTELKGKLLVGVIGSVGVRRDKASVGILSKLLGSQDLEVARAAARALGSIGTEEAAEALLSALSGSGGRIGASIYEGLLRCAEALTESRTRTKALAVYSKLLQDGGAPHQVRTAALRGSVLLKGLEGLKVLREALRGKDPVLFSAAARTALELPGRAVTKVLSDSLSDVKWQRQVFICSVLGKRKDPGALPALLALAKKGRSKARVAAVKALGEIGDPRALPLLLELTDDWVTEVGAAAKRALAGMDGEAVDKALASMLGDADSRRRMQIIAVLGERGAEASLPFLFELVEKGDQALRTACIGAIAKLARRSDFERLVKLLVEARTPLEREALYDALSKLCRRYSKLDPSSVVVVKALYGDLPGGRSADVTKKVAAMVKRGILAIEASNGNFGDPARGIHKKLTVTYRVNGKTVTKTVSEGGVLLISGGKAPAAFIKALRDARGRAPQAAKRILARLLKEAQGAL